MESAGCVVRREGQEAGQGIGKVSHSVRDRQDRSCARERKEPARTAEEKAGAAHVRLQRKGMKDSLDNTVLMLEAL